MFGVLGVQWWIKMKVGGLGTRGGRKKVYGEGL